MPNVILPNVILPNVFLLNVILPNVILPSVILPSVMAPKIQHNEDQEPFHELVLCGLQQRHATHDSIKFFTLVIYSSNLPSQLL
jgi:hypothetical protein